VIHPIHQKLLEVEQEHAKKKLTDPLTLQYSKFPVENDQNPKKLKIIDWNNKEVMLPILGKNKTRLLHTIE
jgi:hypothetical protein